MKPKTGAQRQAAFRAKGKQIACVLTDERAVDALARLTTIHGTVREAVTQALIHAAASSARGSKPPH